MMIYQLLGTLFILFMSVVFGLGLGINVGVGLSNVDGPKVACERLRFQMYKCSVFKNWRVRP